MPKIPLKPAVLSAALAAAALLAACGSTKTQTDALTADWITFAFWRSGLPEWQPKTH